MLLYFPNSKTQCGYIAISQEYHKNSLTPHKNSFSVQLFSPSEVWKK